MKKSMVKTGFVIIIMAFWAPMLSFAEVFTPADDGTFEVTDANNLAGNRLDVSGNATLKLTGTVTDGVFPLKMNIRFLSESATTLTVDASGLSSCTEVRMTGDVRDLGENSVLAFPEGIKRVVAGTDKAVDIDGTDFPVIQSDVSFTDTDGTIVLTNDLTLARRLTCEWSAAPGAHLVILAPQAIADGDFTLTDYNVHIAHPESFAKGATITVPEGLSLILRPFSFRNDTDGAMSGINASVTNNIVLAGGAIRHYNNNDIKGLVGTFSGTGDVYFSGNGNVEEFRGDFNWEGSLTMSGVGTSYAITYTLVPANGATIVPSIKMNHVHGGMFRFAVDGYEEKSTSVRVTSFSQYSADVSKMQPATLSVLQNQTVTVGEVSGLANAVSEGVNSVLVVENLKADAVLNLYPGVALRIESFEEGAQIVLQEDADGVRDWSVSGPSEGEALALPIVYPDDLTGASIALGGKLAFSIEEPIAVPSVTILPDAEVSARVPDGVSISNEGGTFTQLVKTWKDKVTLWVDASAEGTMTLADEDFPDNKSIIDDNRISEWRDCRPDRQGDGAYRFRLTAFDSNSSTLSGTTQVGFPMIDPTYALCGTSPVRLTRNRGRMQTATGKGANASIPVKYALFVFNSADYGGGNAFFYAYGGFLKRVSDGGSNATEGQKPLIYENPDNGFAFRTNGVDVVSPTKTKTTGGWQIISFANANGVEIRNIGHATILNTATGNGGQIFAEILLFGEMPTEEERDAAETYLSKKWNLPIGHEDVTVTESAELSGIFGGGTVALGADTVAGSGMFAGTVNLNGYRLEIPSGLMPFTEATIPSENRVLWIDPSLDDAVVLGGVEEKPDEVSFIYARDNAGRLTASDSLCVASAYPQNGNGRRVRSVPGTRARGSAAVWLEFSNGYGDNTGNHLLVMDGVPSSPGDVPASYADKSFTDVNVKSGFFALDTTKGGGTVLTSVANGKTSDFRHRGFKDTKEAFIWSPESSEAVLGADTYLDGVKVDGACTTFSLKPEIFSFNLQEDETAKKAKAFGFWGDTGNVAYNQEIMGEWILYSETQTDEVRGSIEAYLMWKWLGKLKDGYSDFRGMTASGDGVLAAAGPEYLPALSETFTGSVEFSRTAWSFTLPAAGGTAAVDAVLFEGREMALPEVISADVDLNGAPNGTYTLFKADSITGGDTVTLGAGSKVGNKIVKFVVSDGEIALSVTSRGTMLVIR